MSDYQYDLFVIGAGSGGVRAARMAASFGAKVAVAEAQHLGGTCVNVGCVPKKLLVYASHFPEDVEDANAYGWQTSSLDFSWSRLIANKNTEIERLNGVYQRLLDESGVDTLFGMASLVDDHTVEIDGKQYSADKILLATGGYPFIPEIPGKELAITSNEAFFLKDLPKRVVVVGGGYIAVEFAGIFNGMGAKVQQIYRGEQILRTFDKELAAFAAEQYRLHGIQIDCHTNITSIEKTADGLRCQLDTGEAIDTDLVMYATGRRPNVEALGLDNIQVERRANGTIVVDKAMRTATENIFALGDITGGPELTPVAIAEAMAFAKTQFANDPQTMDYANIPTAVFSQPNIGTVGLTEEEAREQYAEVSIFTSDFKHLKHSITQSKARTFMKIIVDKPTDRVIGLHMIGADAGEIVQGMAVAMKAGATKAIFDSTVGIHPTAAEEFVTMREPVS